MSAKMIRRVDELGRIVIPKEIRRTMRINVGDELEIGVDNECLILKKYSQFENYLSSCKCVVKMIVEYIKGAEALVVNADEIVASYGGTKKVGMKPSTALSKLIIGKSSVVLPINFELFDGINDEGKIAVEPVVVYGDGVGAVVVISKDGFDENQLAYIRFATAVLTSLIAY